MESKENKNSQTSIINFIIDDGKHKRFKLDVNDFKDNSYYKQNPEQFELLCKTLNGKTLLSYRINEHMLKWMCDVTSELDDNSAIKERIYWILTDRHEYPLCRNPNCNNRLNSFKFNTLNIGYTLHCSHECCSSDPEIARKISQANLTKSPEQKQAEIDKRLATYNKHKAEDPEFVKRKQEKSIATRKKNHGEDYTGRKKCKATIKDRYGVDNPMQIQEVKEKIVKHNLETYGVEWHIAASEIREKSRQTCQTNYGVDNPFAAKEVIEQIKQHNIENYGVEHNWQREDVKQHIKQTNKRLYGFESAMQNPKIRARTQKNIKYDGISFDSYPELCLYLWCKNNNIHFEFQPKVSFKYDFDGIVHFYCPDFKLCGNIYVEIKGDHFFKEDGTMRNPWDSSLDGLYEAKHQCMLKNHIVILKSKDYEYFTSYVEQKYGKDFYQYIKQQKNAQHNE